MNEDHVRQQEDVAAYALGALPPLEAAATERHIMRCESCACDLERLRVVVDQLPAAAPQYRAPTGLRQSLMEKVAAEVAEAAPRERPRARRAFGFSLPRPRLALAGGLAALVIAAGSFGIGSTVSGGGDPEVLTAQVDRTRLPGAGASLTRDGDIGVLRANRLPALHGGRVYVVWVDRGRGPEYASAFNTRPDGSGEAGVGSMEGVRAVMVTRERSTDVAGPGEKPVVTVQLA